MLDHSCQVQRAPLSDRGDDLYETPPVAVVALLRAQPLPALLWEPACGPGKIVKVLREAGHTVVASDLVDYGCPESEARVDFLMERRAPAGVQAIVTNPPFKLAAEFVAKAIELCPMVVMLLRLAFLESERRSDILDGGQLARVFVFRKRLPMMNRHGWAGKQANSGMAFAWMVWQRTHHGPATIERISWERPERVGRSEWDSMWRAPYIDPHNPHREKPA